MAQNPIVTFEIERESAFGPETGVIKAELYPEVAPNSVNNFISLVKKGYYDGLIFHRVIAGFMIQGGCPQGSPRHAPQLRRQLVLHHARRGSPPGRPVRRLR